MLGFGSDRKVRYGIIGLGDIAQEAMLPGIAHTGNSEISAIMTGDPEKAKAVGDRYGVPDRYSYEQLDDMLESSAVEAIYLATPNWRHAEFIVPALKAGVHVLVEKPLEISSEKCKEIIAAQHQSNAKLMVAYRLHFEPSTLALIDLVRSGDLGQVHLFTSMFTQFVDPQNHRGRSGDLAGPVLDMAPYPVNAARYIFGAEPTAVMSAVGTRHADAGFGDFDDTVAVTLRFPGDRIAQFSVSYYGSALDTYSAVGTKGHVIANPGFTYHAALGQAITIGEHTTHKTFKHTDQFGGEMRYFSHCILADLHPEPDAEEGYADVRVLEAILRALASGEQQELSPFTRSARINTIAQLEQLGSRKAPELIHAASPSR